MASLSHLLSFSIGGMIRKYQLFEGWTEIADL